MRERAWARSHRRLPQGSRATLLRGPRCQPTTERARPRRGTTRRCRLVTGAVRPGPGPSSERTQLVATATAQWVPRDAFRARRSHDSCRRPSGSCGRCARHRRAPRVGRSRSGHRAGPRGRSGPWRVSREHRAGTGRARGTGRSGVRGSATGVLGPGLGAATGLGRLPSPAFRPWARGRRLARSRSRGLGCPWARTHGSLCSWHR